MSDILTFVTTRVDWTAWLTLTAVLTALYPIYREHRRSKAQARNLRIRFGAALTKLRPSLVNVIKTNNTQGLHAVLSKDDFKRTVRDIELLFSHAAVLEADELDQLGATFLNLELAASLYTTPSLHKESADSNVKMIDHALKIMESRGLTVTKPLTPWETQL